MRKFFQKANKKFIIALLILSITIPYFAVVISKNINREVLPAVESSVINLSKTYNMNFDEPQLSEFDTYNNVVANNLAESDIYSYTTQSNTGTNQTAVTLQEKLLPTGEIVEYIYVNDEIVGYLKYEDNKLIDVELGNNNVYYSYEESGNVSDIYEGSNHYAYSYSGNNSLTELQKNDESLISVLYNEDGKIIQETYPGLSKRMKYSNTHKAEYIYNTENDEEFLFTMDNLLTYEPYNNIVSSNVAINGSNYNVVTSIGYEGETLLLEYNYDYNGTPYITKATDSEGSVEYSYYNDLLVSEAYGNVKITYIYSSDKKVIGIVFGIVNNGNYYEELLPVVVDAFNNIISVNFTTVSDDQAELDMQNDVAVSATYNSFGQKMYYESFEGFDISLGYKSLLQFNNFNLNFYNGKLYSSLTGLSVSDGSDINPREYVNDHSQKTGIQNSTFINSLITENIQENLYTKYNSGSISDIMLFNEGVAKYAADVYIVPSTIEVNNLGAVEHEMYNIYNSSDEEKYLRIKNATNNLGADSFVMYGEEQSVSLGTKQINTQFIYEGKLYKTSLKEQGIVEYEVKTSNLSSHYMPNVNLIDYENNRYIQYYENTVDHTNYFENMDFVYGLNSISDFNNHVVEKNYVDSSYAELFTEQDYGNNVEAVKQLMQNTFSVNIPIYDPETEYIYIDDNGDYQKADITPDMLNDEGEVEETSLLWGGIGLTVFGVIATVAALAIVVPCSGAIAVIVIGLKTLAIATAVIGTAAGVALVHNELTEDGNFIVNDFFGGDGQKLLNFGNTMLTISGIATLGANVVGSFGACFVKDTPILTSNGVVAIQNLTAGDEVLSYDEATGKQSYNKITNTFKRKVDELVKISYNNKVITTTKDHPFFVNNSWVEANSLKSGDNLTTEDGSVAVVKNVSLISQPNTFVYNFEVENTHTYYVSDGILVHNTCVAKNIKKYVDGIGDDPKFAKALDSVKQQIDDGLVNGKKWRKVREAIWKAYGDSLDPSDINYKRFVNLDLMIEKGQAPLLKAGEGVLSKYQRRIQLHHVYGKLNTSVPGTMYKVVPMQARPHTIFHKTYSYHHAKGIDGGFKFVGKFTELIKVSFK